MSAIAWIKLWLRDCQPIAYRTFRKRVEARRAELETEYERRRQDEVQRRAKESAAETTRHLKAEAELKGRLDKIIDKAVMITFPRPDTDKYAVVVEFSPEVFTSRYWTRLDFELLAEQVSLHVYQEIASTRFLQKSNHEWLEKQMADSLNDRPPFPGSLSPNGGKSI